MGDVTVLMAVYNGGSYLRKSIESVLAQTYENFDFLIINDCSKDETVDIIETFNDPRIVLHTNHKNIGQTASLNLGLQLAKGKYIARIDADDRANYTWLEKLVSVMVKDSSISVLSCASNVIDERDVVYKTFFPPEKFEDIKLRALLESPINHVGSLMKKSVILETGGYPSEYQVSADYFLWIKLIQNNQKKFYP